MTNETLAHKNNVVSFTKMVDQFVIFLSSPDIYTSTSARDKVVQKYQITLKGILLRKWMTTVLYNTSITRVGKQHDLLLLYLLLLGRSLGGIGFFVQSFGMRVHHLRELLDDVVECVIISGHVVRTDLFVQRG